MWVTFPLDNHDSVVLNKYQVEDEAAVEIPEHITTGMFPVGPPGSRPGAGAAAIRTGRRTMADVVWSGRPAAPTKPTTSSRPAEAVGASYRPAAGDRARVQVTLVGEPAWEMAAFLQSAWTVVSERSGCLYYEPKPSCS
ncbi:hypothetical protein HPB50_027822 [Hyalomma asiaticum]|nr:hypothetical protein HPB50_027822 [Hyalomma asiaticum]